MEKKILLLIMVLLFATGAKIVHIGYVYAHRERVAPCPRHVSGHYIGRYTKDCHKKEVS